jgi:ABC-type methionine transport system ATPase subunit
LIRCLNGFEKPVTENITIGKNEITKFNRRELRSAGKNRYDISTI